MGNKQAKLKEINGNDEASTLGLLDTIPTECLWIILRFLCDDLSFQGPELLLTLNSFSLANKACHELCHFHMFKYIYQNNPFFNNIHYDQLCQSQVKSNTSKTHLFQRLIISIRSRLIGSNSKNNITTGSLPGAEN